LFLRLLDAMAQPFQIHSGLAGQKRRLAGRFARGLRQ
jgi:hypothetical protein